MVPPNGCPDPVEIAVSDNLTIIAFDSEWWLFPYDKDNPDADCDCSTEKDTFSEKWMPCYTRTGTKSSSWLPIILFNPMARMAGISHGKTICSLSPRFIRTFCIPLPVLGSQIHPGITERRVPEPGGPASSALQGYDQPGRPCL